MATTTSQSTYYYPWMNQATQDVYNWGKGMVSPWLQNTPSHVVAGINPDMEMAYGLTRDLAQSAFGAPGGSPFDFRTDSQTTFNPQATTGTAALASAATTGMDEITGMMSPYMKAVTDVALGRLKDNRADANAEIGARSAAESPFGGTGEVLRKAQLDKNYLKQVAETTAQGQQDAFNAAQSVATQNTANEQQTGLANANSQNAMTTANMGAENSMEQIRANMAGDNVARLLQAFGLQTSADTATQNRQLQALQALSGIGSQQRGISQEALNIPWTMLERLMALTPKTYDSLTTQTGNGGGTSTEQQVLGGILSVLGLGTGGGSTVGGGLLNAVGLSDKTEKTDIKKVGTDDATGLDLYAYRYKGDPKTYPKVVGPMAQDIEKIFPRAVSEVGGKKVVNTSGNSNLARLLKVA